MKEIKNFKNYWLKDPETGANINLNDFINYKEKEAEKELACKLKLLFAANDMDEAYKMVEYVSNSHNKDTKENKECKWLYADGCYHPDPEEQEKCGFYFDNHNCPLFEEKK